LTGAAVLARLREIQQQKQALDVEELALIARAEAEGLAYELGAKNTAVLLRDLLHISARDAAGRVKLAAAVTPRRTLTGEPVEAAHPQTAAALADGSISTRHAATVVAMTAGEVIIRQGEPADAFYVIADGRVEVTQTPAEGGQARVLRQEGEGEFFGEIGLLSNVPRTATVTAVTDGKLVALDRDPFLELVRAGQGLTYRLLDLHRGATTTAG